MEISTPGEEWANEGREENDTGRSDEEGCAGYFQNTHVQVCKEVLFATERGANWPPQYVLCSQDCDDVVGRRVPGGGKIKQHHHHQRSQVYGRCESMAEGSETRLEMGGWRAGVQAFLEAGRRGEKAHNATENF